MLTGELTQFQEFTLPSHRFGFGFTQMEAASRTLTGECTVYTVHSNRSIRSKYKSQLIPSTP